MPKEVTNKTQLRRWAFTVWEKHCTKDDLLEKLKGDTNVTRWVFQKETTDDGDVHFQGRMSLKSPKRLTEVKWLVGKGHLSPEHDEKGSEFYCMDERKRLEGPWSDKVGNTLDFGAFKNPSFKPLPWWEPALKILTEQMEDCWSREILWIMDDGNTGKSWFIKWLRQYHGAIQIDACQSSGSDIMQMAHGLIPHKGWKGIICVNLPRATKTSHMSLVCNILEQLKDGHIVDRRYKVQQLDLDHPPALMICCNQRPPMGALSANREKYFNPADYK